MDEKQQIEEMRKIMCEEYGAMCNECVLGGDCANELISERLYNAGYRNCKDKVVLTREEFEAIMQEKARLKDIVDRIPVGYELKEITRKETAREILKKLYTVLWNEKITIANTFVNLDVEIREIAKQYGVEVEE